MGGGRGGEWGEEGEGGGGGGSNSERCLKWGGEVIKDSVSKNILRTFIIDRS